MSSPQSVRAHRCHCGELHHPEAKPKRPKKPATAGEVRAMLGRMLKSYRERVAGDEEDLNTEGLEALKQLVTMRAEVEEAITGSILRLHAEDRASWQQVAEALGVTRRAVIMRYGPSGAGAQR